MRDFKRFVPYRDRPLVYADVETTGRTPGYHEISEIGFLHEKKGPLCIQIAPQHLDRAEPEALKISRYNKSDWIDARPFKDVAPRIAEYLEDATVIGHNFMGFDVPMIHGNFEMAGLDSSGLLRDVIDTMALARQFLVPLGLNQLKLEACMKFMGESYEGAHSVYEDCIFTKKLHTFITGNLKWHGRKDGKTIQEDLFA